jgi:hypothetical protein
LIKVISLAIWQEILDQQEKHCEGRSGEGRLSSPQILFPTLRRRRSRVRGVVCCQCHGATDETRDDQTNKQHVFRS